MFPCSATVSYFLVEVSGRVRGNASTQKVQHSFIVGKNYIYFLLFWIGSSPSMSISWVRCTRAWYLTSLYDCEKFYNSFCAHVFWIGSSPSVSICWVRPYPSLIFDWLVRLCNKFYQTVFLLRSRILNRFQSVCIHMLNPSVSICWVRLRPSVKEPAATFRNWHQKNHFIVRL